MFFRQHTLKLFALALWLGLIVGYFFCAWYYGFTQARALAWLMGVVDSPYGPLIYILLYIVHPLIFFSAAVLSIAGGALFGAGSTTNLIWAILYTELGSQTSAHVAYWIGRYFGAGVLPAGRHDNFLQRYAERMRQHSFETVFIMRLLFLPFDLVDYAAGIVGVHWGAFALATLAGSFPGTVAFVSFGASLDLKQFLRGDKPTFDPKIFGFSLLIFALSLLISRFLRKRDTR